VRSISRLFVVLAVLLLLPGLFAHDVFAAAGRIRGRVLDPNGGALAGVRLYLLNDITGFKAEATTGADGAYEFVNVPFNPYVISADVEGFAPLRRPVDVRSVIPLQIPITLKVANLEESVTVTAEQTAAQLETDTSMSHVDVDKSYISRAPATVASRAMEELITATPGFAKDENGRFHFQGFHSQSEYVIDGQTISDQTGITFSNSIDPGIAQSMEVIYGNVPAEYGEKIGTVVNLVTKSGLNSPFHGDVYGGLARYATYEGGLELGGGSRNFAAFASVNGSTSDRFLDPVNFDSLHNTGDTQRGFVRLDYASDELRDQVRFTALVGRTNRDVPNTFTQQDAGQAQTVGSRDQNYNLGWTHLLSPRATLEANAFGRVSTFKLRPSVGDTPVTAISDRSLDNYGLNVALTWSTGSHHEVKVGGIVKRFPIEEVFSFGITDPAFNDPESEGYNPDLAPYDLTRGGQLLVFNGSRTGTYAAGYVQDNIHYGGLTANLGLRYDHNDLPTTEDQLEPRVGLAYYVEETGTVLRAAYNRIFVTPEYENILFGSSELAASVVPPEVEDSRALGGGVLLNRSERQNAWLVGAQQALGSRLRLDFDLWWRRATYPGDQDQFFNTGIVFPITFSEGRHNGWDLRLDLAATHGLRGFVSFGHTHAVYVPPPVGGLFLDAESIDAITGGPFLIDHDQKLQAQGQLFWDIGRSGAWLGVNVRYDSGLVTDADPSELLQSPDDFFAAPYVVVHSGTELDPNRIKERTIASFSAGVDFARHGVPVSVQADLLNAFDTQGVYNIQSVFGGTHVIPPRTLAVRARYSFGGRRR
jgi:Carboxypeptidase regulatory-like domain/TonB-dependent Receptor Plug Domain